MNRKQAPSGTPDTSQSAPLLVTAAEAGRMLAIGRTTVYQLVWSGEITPVHIGRSVRFPVAELHEFIERQIASEVGRVGS